MNLDVVEKKQKLIKRFLPNLGSNIKQSKVVLL